MIVKTNTFKNVERGASQDKKKKLKHKNSYLKKIGKSFRSALDGTFIVRYNVFKQTPFLLYIMLWAVVLIANGYNVERKVRKIEKLNTEILELHLEYITVKSELMYYSRLSEIAEKIKNTGVNISTKPPYKIFMEE